MRYIDSMKSPTHSPGTAALVLFAGCLVLFVTGCEYSEPNPKAYPYQFRHIRTFSLDTQAIEPFVADSLPDPFLVVAHLGHRGLSNERYLQIEAPSGSPNLGRFNLERATSFPRQVPFYDMSFVADDQTNTRWICFSQKTDTSQTCYMFDLLKGQSTSLLQDVNVPYRPLQGISNEVTVSRPIASADSSTFVGVVYPSSLKVWRLRMMRLDDKHHVLFDIQTGVRVNVRFIHETERSGQHRFVGVSSAPGNGMGNALFTDEYSYVFCYDDHGTLLWYRNTGGGGGSAEVVPWQDRLLVVRSGISLQESKVTTLWLLDPETGSTVDSTTTLGQTRLVFHAGITPELVVDQGVDPDLFVGMFRHLRFHATPGFAVSDGVHYSRIEIAGSREQNGPAYLVVDETRSWLLDTQFQPLGVIEGRIQSNHAKRSTEVILAGKHAILIDRDGRFNLYELVHVPWYGWWFHRHWLNLLVGVIVPLLVVLLYIWYKHAKLRIEKQKQDKLYQQKLKQISEASTRENSSIRADTQSFLHSNVCAVLLYCGREMEELAKEVDDKLFHKSLRMIKLLFDSEREVRTSSRSLLPSLVQFEYADMLRSVVEQYSHSFACSCEIEEDKVDFGSDVKLDLFLCIQDALINVHRHSKASSVIVRSYTSASPVRIQIEDNGIGIRELDKHQSESLGLVLMETRMLAHGGTCEVRSHDSAGTTVELRLPVERRFDELTGVWMLIPSRLDTVKSEGS